MFKNKLLIFSLIFFFSQPIWAQLYPRFNHVGYSPDAPKVIFIQADQNSSSLKWQLIDSSGQNLLSGILGNSLDSIGKHCPKPFNYKIDLSSIHQVGKYFLSLETHPEKVAFQVKENPTRFIVSDMLRFLRVQRSGTTTTLDSRCSHIGDKNCPIWTKKSASNSSWQLNENHNSVNMLGGWYDAGDYIKFTLTTAYTSYLLLRSYNENPNLFQEKKYSKSSLNDLLDEAKWGLEYLLKTHPNTNTFIIQVGSADDHKQGERLPHLDELNTKRQAYHAFSPTQMGYTAAALALGAATFQSVDPAFSEKCKTKAVEIFQKSLNYTENAWIEDGWETFYADKNYNDNLELAAIELYHLTQEKHYLVLAKKYMHLAKQAWWSSWANINMVAHERLAEFEPEAISYLKADLDYFKGIALEKNNLWATPHPYTWASLYSMLGVANASLLSQKHQIENYQLIYESMLDYTLGRNPWGICFVASPSIPNSIRNVYSQVYKLQPKKYPIGAIAEGPGDRATHDNLKQYFKIPAQNPFEAFQTKDAVFYDLNTDFQCMETTIVGLADGIFFFSLIDKEINSKK